VSTNANPTEGAEAAPRRVRFLVIFGVWTLIGLWSAQQNALLSITTEGRVESWWRLLASALISHWFWALLTPLLMWHTRRIRDDVRPMAAVVAIHVVTLLAVHVADTVMYGALRSLLGMPTRPFRELVFAIGSYNVLTYGLVLFATLALDYRSALRDRAVRTAQLETQLAVARFQALRAQLQPHFLFNSLNAISALIQNDPERAERMLARLSQLLRIAIDTAGTPEIRLVDEVDFVRRYLEIEQLRYGDRLQVSIDLADDTLDSLVPGMLLQPLVENAVRHGVAPHPWPGAVSVHARRRGAHLELVVTDTGRGMSTRSNNGSGAGVGLQTTRARLETLYGDRQSLTLVNLPGGGFETRVTLPWKVAAEVPA
jgi:sensor histidine kinase YesM